MGKEIIVKISDIEEGLGIKLRRNSIVLGLDTATTTGYSIAESNCRNVKFNNGFFVVDLKNIKDKKLREDLRYDTIYQNLSNIIDVKYDVVIENVYYGGNAKTLIILSRIGALAYAIARNKNISKDRIKWMTAGEARKSLGLKGNAKKPEIMSGINKVLGTDIKNDNIVDAIVLAICGLIDHV